MKAHYFLFISHHTTLKISIKTHKSARGPHQPAGGLGAFTWGVFSRPSESSRISSKGVEGVESVESAESVEGVKSVKSVILRRKCYAASRSVESIKLALKESLVGSTHIEYLYIQ